MTEEEIDAIEQGMRKQFPDMFNHQEIKEGEFFLKMVPAGEFLEYSILTVREKGFTSARAGETVMLPGNINGRPGGRKLPFAPVYANLREAILLENTRSKENVS